MLAPLLREHLATHRNRGLRAGRRQGLLPPLDPGRATEDEDQSHHPRTLRPDRPTQSQGSRRRATAGLRPRAVLPPQHRRTRLEPTQGPGPLRCGFVSWAVRFCSQRMWPRVGRASRRQSKGGSFRRCTSGPGQTSPVRLPNARSASPTVGARANRAQDPSSCSVGTPTTPASLPGPKPHPDSGRLGQGVSGPAQGRALARLTARAGRPPRAVLGRRERASTRT